MSAVNLTRLISVKPGKRHAWYETTEGFKVRKPFTTLPVRPAPKIEQVSLAKLSLWQRIKAFFVSFFR